MLVTARGLPDLATRCGCHTLHMCVASAPSPVTAEGSVYRMYLLSIVLGFWSCRAFLAKLSASYPALPLLGLVDWNPAGVTILTTYKQGAVRMGLEAGR